MAVCLHGVVFKQRLHNSHFVLGYLANSQLMPPLHSVVAELLMALMRLEGGAVCCVYTVISICCMLMQNNDLNL